MTSESLSKITALTFGVKLTSIQRSCRVLAGQIIGISFMKVNFMKTAGRVLEGLYTKMGATMWGSGKMIGEMGKERQ